MEVLFSEKLMSRILNQAYNKSEFVVNLLEVEPREPNFKYIFLN